MQWKVNSYGDCSEEKGIDDEPSNMRVASKAYTKGRGAFFGLTHSSNAVLNLSSALTLLNAYTCLVF